MAAAPPDGRRGPPLAGPATPRAAAVPAGPRRRTAALDPSGRQLGFSQLSGRLRCRRPERPRASATVVGQPAAGRRRPGDPYGNVGRAVLRRHRAAVSAALPPPRVPPCRHAGVPPSWPAPAVPPHRHADTVVPPGLWRRRRRSRRQSVPPNPCRHAVDSRRRRPALRARAPWRRPARVRPAVPPGPCSFGGSITSVSAATGRAAPGAWACLGPAPRRRRWRWRLSSANEAEA
jgi:hypothetical protein